MDVPFRPRSGISFNAEVAEAAEETRIRGKSSSYKSGKIIRAESHRERQIDIYSSSPEQLSLADRDQSLLYSCSERLIVMISEKSLSLTGEVR